MDRVVNIMLSGLAAASLSFFSFAPASAFASAAYAPSGVSIQSVQRVAPFQSTTYVTAKASNAPIFLPKQKALPVSYSGSRVLELAKKAKNASAVNVAIIGALASVDWLMSEGTIVQKTVDLPANTHAPGAPYQGLYYKTNSVYINNVQHTFYATSSDAVYFDYYNYIMSNVTYEWIVEDSYANGLIKLSLCTTAPNGNSCSSNKLLSFNNAVNSYQCGASTTVCNAQEIESPVSDSDQVAVIVPALYDLPSSELEDVFMDDFGQPLVTPEIQSALDVWAGSLAAADLNLEYDSLSHTFTETNPDTGAQTTTSMQQSLNEDPSVSNVEAPAQVESILPDACSWFVKACDFIDWFKDEPADLAVDDLPIQDISATDFEQSYESGLGSGSCPPPVSFGYGSFAGQYKFDTVCSAAQTFFRPMAIAMASIIAAFVIVGASRKGG